ncbi:MAG: TRAP transporter small permease [Clostridia bacterium]|nr:TRAP transporter small permease [Clostridia bacterium]MDH7573119.1 TRAP transporter small permease [Clostridia bacterium]
MAEEAPNGQGLWRKAEEGLNLGSVALLLIMMFLGAFDVIGRYLFNSPITGAMEWSQMLQVGLVFLALGYVQATDSHVKMEFFLVRYPRNLQKAIIIAGLALTFVVFALMLWQSALIAVADLKQGRLIETVLLPIYPFKFLVPIGSFFVCVECGLQIISKLKPS